MILLERIKTNLSMAVMLKDDLSTDKKVIGDVFMKASGIKKPVVKHSTGYFLLTNLAEGKYSITGGGKFYREGVLTVDTKSINPKQPFVELSLKPKSSYPFPEGITVLKGRITDTENKPVANASIKLKGMTESAISEDGGGFFIQFKAMDADKNITMTINKDTYKPKDVTVPVKKGTTARAETIMLTKK